MKTSVQISDLKQVILLCVVYFQYTRHSISLFDKSLCTTYCLYHAIHSTDMYVFFSKLAYQMNLQKSPGGDVMYHCCCILLYCTCSALEAFEVVQLTHRVTQNLNICIYFNFGNWVFDYVVTANYLTNFWS